MSAKHIRTDSSPAGEHIDSYTIKTLAPPVFLRPVEFARRLGVGRTTAFAMLKRGDVRVVRLGGLSLIPVEDVDALIARLVASATRGKSREAK